MPTHRRGRSLSEALTLEQSNDGGLVISSISDNTAANQGLSEGDEIVGATINFDQLSKQEVLEVLKLMKPFDDKIQVLTKNNLSKSLGNLDQCVRSPETMLKDSYSKLYNAKIKKFMKDDLPHAERGINEEVTDKPTVPGSSKVSLKNDTGLPRLGVDFGRLKTKTPNADSDADSQSSDVTFSAETAGELTDGSNLDVPVLGLDVNGPDLSGDLVKEGSRDTDSPSVDLTIPNFERTQIELKNNETFTTPQMDIVNGGHITSVPKVDIEGTHKSLKMPKFKLPDLGLSGPALCGSGYDVETPNIETPDVATGKIGPKSSKRLKYLNVDDPSSFVESPKLSLSGKSPDFGLETPGMNMSQLDVNGPAIDLPSGEVKVPLKKPKNDLKAPYLDLDSPSNKFNIPNIGLSDKSDTDVKTPDLSLKMPKIKAEIDAPDIKGPSMKYKAPKFTMPQFDLPNIKVPGLNGDLEGPDVQLAAPELEAGIADPKLNVPSTDLDISSPSGKHKMPGFGHSGPKVKGPGYPLKTLDLDLSAPNIKEGMHLPGIDGKDPKVQLNNPDVGIKKPSDKLDIDADGPSGKFKFPKFKLFGTLPKKKDVDINAGMKTPELTLKSPKMKGIAAPDLSLPNTDLKAPNLDLHSPDVNIGSPKGKPNFDLSGPKRPNIDVDGSLNRPHLPSDGLDINLSKPQFDIDVPSLDGVRPKMDQPKLDLTGPDANLDMPSGQFKVPTINKPNIDLNAPDVHIDDPSGKLQMPELNISGTLPKGPNMDTDLKSPDFSLKAPKIKGGIDTPDLDLPNMDLKAPKLDMNSPDVNIGSPKAKFKMPKLKKPKFNLPSLKRPEIDGNLDSPDVDLNVPNVNIKGPKVDVTVPDVDMAGKSKKPNLNLPDLGLSGPKLNDPNFDFKSSDLDLSGPNLSGATNAPDLNMPKVDLKSSKLDFSTPNVNSDMLLGEMKMPELQAPEFDVNASGTLPKGPHLDSNLKSPDLGLKAPKIKGEIDTTDLDFKSPQLDMNTPDVNIGSPKAKFKLPKLKLPKFTIPSLKGPETDGNMDVPHVDINAPNLKGPKTDLDVDITGPSGKPKLNLPDLGLSGPTFDAPNLDLKSPDLGFSGPNLKGGINAPDLNMPKVDIKSPKLDLNTPKLNLDMPSGKLKMPTLANPNTEFHVPDCDVSGTLPKGPNMDINTGDLKSPDFSLKAPKGGIDTPDLDLKAPKLDTNTPDVNIGSPKAKFKMPKLKLPKFTIPSLKGPETDGDISGPMANPAAVNLSAPKLKQPAMSVPDLDLPDASLKGPSLDLNAKHPDLGINGNIEQPDMNFTAPNIRGGVRGPDIDMNVPSGNIQDPQADLDLPNKKLKLPSFKLPHFGSSDLRTGSDIDFGASLNPENLHISPPNAKLKMKPQELKGNITDPKVSDANVELSMPKAGIQNTQLHLKSPEIDIDDPSLKKLKNPSHKKRRSDITEGNMRTPALDIDRDVRFRHSDGKPPKTRAKSNHPVMDAKLDPKLDFNHSDLNIDDFTGKLHVPKARGSPSGVNMKDPRHDGKHQGAAQPVTDARLPQQDSPVRLPDSSDGYYVTVFPTQAQNQKKPNRKYNTLGGPHFYPGNVNLEVPDENYLKGSTFFFSNLM